MSSEHSLYKRVCIKTQEAKGAELGCAGVLSFLLLRSIPKGIPIPHPLYRDLICVSPSCFNTLRSLFSFLFPFFFLLLFLSTRCYTLFPRRYLARLAAPRGWEGTSSWRSRKGQVWVPRADRDTRLAERDARREQQTIALGDDWKLYGDQLLRLPNCWLLTADWYSSLYFEL